MSGGPSPTASTMPSFGGRSCVPCGTSSPDLRMRSGSSSLITTWSNSGRRTSGIGRHLAVVVVAPVIGVEPDAQPAAVGPTLERTDLARVGLQHDVRHARRADGEEADGRVGAVHDLVRAGLAR